MTDASARKLAAQLDGIVTFSDAETIFGGQTIRISNGIDFDAIPQKITRNDTSRELHLIGVAEVHYWHGFDRIIKGMADYYATHPSYKVYFHIVGALTGERERREILPVIAQYKLEPFVILHGQQHGEQLDKDIRTVRFRHRKPGKAPERNHNHQDTQEPGICGPGTTFHLLRNGYRL